jgi:hypothetical protein
MMKKKKDRRKMYKEKRVVVVMVEKVMYEVTFFFSPLLCMRERNQVKSRLIHPSIHLIKRAN